MLTFLKWFLGILILLAISAWGLIYFGSFHPKPIQSEKVISSTKSPLLRPGQKVKVLSWNVQYMAGKNYVFWYDLPNDQGPDIRPEYQDISTTLEAVAKVIVEEDPDIILLQEVDDGAKRTYQEDQLEKLLMLLPGDYTSYTEAFYWKANFIPHTKIWGSVGMKLVVISKYHLQGALRHQLALIEKKTWYNWLERQFHLKRAIQEVQVPIQGGKYLTVFNTHLSAFAQGTNTMQKQVAQINALVGQQDRQENIWVLGGDFNLLPPGKKPYASLAADQQVAYNPSTEIIPLFQNFQSVPSRTEANGQNMKDWFTHFPNDPSVLAPDRTIDYLFLPKSVKVDRHYIRHKDTHKISDHLPVVTEFTIPNS